MFWHCEVKGVIVDPDDFIADEEEERVNEVAEADQQAVD